MNKKGFTLIEIIICISLIVVIGLGSFFAVRYVSNKELIKKLEQITDSAINAAHVYIETNEETYNQLYNNKNGVSLPLQLLVKEGLLNLDNTELTESDIKDQYVITFLGSNNSNDSCEQITSTTSWGNDKEIYLCLNTGNITVSLEESNYAILTKEKYVFKGESPDNYVQYKDNIYRIMSVEKDDSLVLVSKGSFGTLFDGLTHEIEYYVRGYYKNAATNYETTYEVILNVTGNSCEGIECIIMKGEKSYHNGEVLLSLKDIADTSKIIRLEKPNYSNYDRLYSYVNELIGVEYVDIYGYSVTNERWWEYPTPIQGYKIHIRNCFRITGGIGTYTVPYILENKCIN